MPKHLRICEWKSSGFCSVDGKITNKCKPVCGCKKQLPYTTTTATLCRIHLLQVCSTLSNRTNFSPDTLSVLCWTTTGFFSQKNVFPGVVSLYMEAAETRALSSITGTRPRHRLRYVDDDTWVKIKTGESFYRSQCCDMKLSFCIFL